MKKIEYEWCAGEVKMTYKRNDTIQRTKVMTSHDLFLAALKIIDDDVLDYSEEMWVLFLDTRNYMTAYMNVSKGGAASMSVDVKQIIQAALMTNSAGIALFHNHPSGETSPSRHDDTMTKAVKRSCEMMDLRLCDHVILTRDKYYSYADKGRI